MLLPDFYLAGRWQGPHEMEVAAYYIEWRRGQAARFVPFLHNPTVCLPMAGCEMVRSLGDIPVRWSGGTIPFHAYLFRSAGEEFPVAFAIWDNSRGAPLDSRSGSAQGRWAEIKRRWDDVEQARRDQPAQLLSVSLRGDKAREALPALLESLIQACRPSGIPDA